MKNKLVLLGSILLCMCLFASCSDDDDVDYAPQLVGNYTGDYADSSDLFGATEDEPANIVTTGVNKIKITFTKKSKSYEINIDGKGSNGNTIVGTNSNSTLSYSTSNGVLSLNVGTISYQAPKVVQK